MNACVEVPVECWKGAGVCLAIEKIAMPGVCLHTFVRLKSASRSQLRQSSSGHSVDTGITVVGTERETVTVNNTYGRQIRRMTSNSDSRQPSVTVLFHIYLCIKTLLASFDLCFT